MRIALLAKKRQGLAVTIKASAHSLKVDLKLRRGGVIQAGAAPGGEGVDLCRGEVREEGGRGLSKPPALI